jgi:hypothetical protein
MPNAVRRVTPRLASKSAEHFYSLKIETSDPRNQTNCGAAAIFGTIRPQVIGGDSPYGA